MPNCESIHVPICKSFLVTEAERKHVRRSARFQLHGNASCHQDFFPHAWQGAEGNSRHSERNIRGTCTIVCRRLKLGGLQKLEQRTKKCTELRGEYVE